MIVLILAAGEQTRWGDNGRPKQLVDIGGEPLLVRLVRQCRERGHEPVVVTHDDRLKLSQRTFAPAARRWVVETLLFTRELWEPRTVVLLGDVVFTEEAIDKVLACRSPMQVFGRKELRWRLVGRYYEIFALSFDRACHQRIGWTLDKSIEEALRRPGPLAGKLRTFYEVYCGLDLGSFQHEDEVFYPIEDWTEDIDAPEDYQQFVDMIVRRGWV